MACKRPLFASLEVPVHRGGVSGGVSNTSMGMGWNVAANYELATDVPARTPVGVQQVITAASAQLHVRKRRASPPSFALNCRGRVGFGATDEPGATMDVTRASRAPVFVQQVLSGAPQLPVRPNGDVHTGGRVIGGMPASLNPSLKRAKPDDGAPVYNGEYQCFRRMAGTF